MRIAYIGSAHGTSLHRARALDRVGHDVTVIDPFNWLGSSKWMSRWLQYTGGIGVGSLLNNRLFQKTCELRPDFIWIDHGSFLGPDIISRLRSLNVPIINYLIDDPFGKRDGRRFHAYLNALPHYDLVVVVRKQNIEEAKAKGARRVLRVWMSADEIAHHPIHPTQQEFAKFSSEVSFIGRWMPERGPFLFRLIAEKIPLSFWGRGWEKAPEWPSLRPFFRGPRLNDSRSYAAAVRCSKIC